MEHTEQHTKTIVSMISAVIAIILSDIQTYVSLTAGIVAILSGCMAIRHYYYSTKKVKEKE